MKATRFSLLLLLWAAIVSNTACSNADTLGTVPAPRALSPEDDTSTNTNQDATTSSSSTTTTSTAAMSSTTTQDDRLPPDDLFQVDCMQDPQHVLCSSLDDGNGTEVPGDGQGGDGGGDGDDPDHDHSAAPKVELPVWVALGGVASGGPRRERALRLVLSRVVTNQLNLHSPFSVEFTALKEDREHEQDSNHNVRELYGHSGQGQHHHHGPNRRNSASDDRPKPPPARLVHFNTTVQEEAEDDDSSLLPSQVDAVDVTWAQVQVNYFAYWNDEESKKIHRADVVETIARVCRLVIQESIASGAFWVDMQDELQDYETNDVQTGGLPLSPPIVALGLVRGDGDSYASSSSSTSSEEESPRPAAEVFTTKKKRPPTWLYPITTDWSTREYVGLAVLSTMLTLVTLLGFCARTLRRRRPFVSYKQHSLPPGLTEDGVRELLQLGWRYQEGPAQTVPEKQNQQQEESTLFLQVFPKAHVGYSDENSLLQGGHHWVHSASAPDGNAAGAAAVSTTQPSSASAASAAPRPLQ